MSDDKKTDINQIIKDFDIGQIITPGSNWNIITSSLRGDKPQPITLKTLITILILIPVLYVSVWGINALCWHFMPKDKPIPITTNYSVPNTDYYAIPIPEMPPMPTIPIP